MTLKPVKDLPSPSWLADARNLRENIISWIDKQVASRVNDELMRAQMGETKQKISVDMPKDISTPHSANEAEQKFIISHLEEIMEPLGYTWKFEKAKNRHLSEHEYPWVLYLEWELDIS